MPEQAKLPSEVDNLKEELAEALRTTAQQADEQARTNARLDLFEAVTDMLPVGVVVAVAPSGEIVFGNARSKAIFGHETHHSADYDSYGEWVSYHEDGRRVETHEYPLSRVLRDGEPYAEIDVLYARGNGNRAWIRIIGEPLSDGEELIGAVVVVLDVDKERRLQNQKDILIAELDHRVKNAFTTVKSIAEQSLTDPSRVAEEAALLPARLETYAAVHAALTQVGWGPLPLGDLIATATNEGAFAAHCGSELGINPADALVLAMILHELCEAGGSSNGARNAPTGIHCEDGKEEMILTWRERLGAPSRYTVDSGFRRTVLTTFAQRQLGSAPELKRKGEEAVWTIRIPKRTS